MEMIVKDNEAARVALRGAAADAGVSITKMGELGGLTTGSLIRFVSNIGRKENQAGEKIGMLADTNCHLLTFLKALDGVGYEVVVRPKVTGSRRERRLKAMKERANGKQEAPSS